MPLVFYDLNFIVASHQGVDGYKEHLQQLGVGFVPFVDPAECESQKNRTVLLLFAALFQELIHVATKLRFQDFLVCGVLRVCLYEIGIDATKHLLDVFHTT